jgi:MFS family permease
MDSDTESAELIESTYAKVFGIAQPTENAVRLVKILSILLPSFAASFQISTSFYMIFIAETLGGDYITGIAYVGVLVTVQLAIQTLLDYPTGAIGDWIGQRYVIASALFCYSAAFFLTAQVTPDTPFTIFLFIYALFGLGSSQESGAFNAWFDNNYRVAMPHDVDRKQYGVFQGRLGMVWQVSSTLVLIPGSYLAFITSRNWVFFLQSIFCIVLAIIVMMVVKDLPGVRDESEKRPSLSEYKNLLLDGVRFLTSTRFITFLVLGEVVLFSVGPVWWNLNLFPFYYWFLLTEVAVSSFRTLVFIPQAIANERSGVWSRRFDAEKWIPRFRFLQFGGPVFYVILALIVHTFPGAVEGVAVIPFIDFPVSTLIPVLLIFITFVGVSLFGGFAGILTQRVMLDVIPNRIRNSMYSLEPTLVMLLSMPLLLFFGWLTSATGFTLPFAFCAEITLIGVLLIAIAFTYPIVKAEVHMAEEEEVEVVQELEIT